MTRVDFGKSDPHTTKGSPMGNLLWFLYVLILWTAHFFMWGVKEERARNVFQKRRQPGIANLRAPTSSDPSNRFPTGRGDPVHVRVVPRRHDV
jgi:hypothetical protein